MNDPRKDAKLRLWGDAEQAAIRLCHSDGTDYGEPYDDWPENIETDGEVWENQASARNHYREVSRSVLMAAFDYGWHGKSGLAAPWPFYEERIDE